MVQKALAEGLRLQVFFDPSVHGRFDSCKRYTAEAELAQFLGLPASSVTIAMDGAEVDPWIIKFAQRTGAHVITNDRFRDRPEAQGLEAMRVQFIRRQPYFEQA